MMPRAVWKMKAAIPENWRRSVKINRALWAERLGSWRFSSPALFDLDAKLASFLPSTGVFLEIGANDGYSQSNTYHLERSGWTGILIEPVPRFFNICKRVRPQSYCFNYACSGEDGVDVEMVEQGLMSVALGRTTREETRVLSETASRVTVPSARLSDLIDKTPYKAITFMSIDVEGAEMDVLAGLDLSRHAPEWLLIESDQLDLVTELLSDTMRHEAQLTYHDHLFVRHNPPPDSAETA